jgi:chromate transport protein ChrA
MWCCKGDDKGGKAKMLCPVSLGLAIGIVGFFAVLIWNLWVMHYGMPSVMVAMHVPMPTLRGGFEHALLVLLKGFLFGFFVALLYDFFASCCAGKKRG